MLAAVLLLFIALSNPLVSEWSDMETTKNLIRTVAKDYREEQWFDWACYVWVKEVSLGALMYAMQMQEGWLRPGTLWYRTNNPWSLHKAQWLKEVVGVWWESTTWPHYKTLYDWMYEHAHLLVKWKYYQCKLTYKSVFSYIHWPNANPNDLYPPLASKGVTRAQYTQLKLWEALNSALEFDRSKWEVLDMIEKKAISNWSVSVPAQKIPPKGTDAVVETDERICYKVQTTKANFVQFDDLEWKFVDKIDLPWWALKMYKCFNK